MTPTISGPYQHENLSLFFLHRPDAADTSRYVTLEEALDQKQVMIHETGQVGETQVKLCKSMNESGVSKESGSSLELTLEYEKVKRRQADFQNAFWPLVNQHADAVGFVFTINGKINTGEVYAAHNLFRRLWGKLLNAAIVEAVAESEAGSGTNPRTSVQPLTTADVERFLAQAETGADQEQSLSDRVCLHTKRTPKSVLFETEDKAIQAARIHQNYMCEGA